MLTARYERRVANALAGEVVCAESDREALEACTHAPVSVKVVANGIDPEAFPDQGSLTEAPVFMLPGAMDYQPNIDGARWFVERAWPIVRMVRPDAQLNIVGRDPTDEVTAWTATTVSTSPAGFQACCRGTAMRALLWHRSASDAVRGSRLSKHGASADHSWPRPWPSMASMLSTTETACSPTNRGRSQAPASMRWPLPPLNAYAKAALQPPRTMTGTRVSPICHDWQSDIEMEADHASATNA